MGEALISGLIAASLFPAEKIMVYDVIASRVQYLEKKFAIRGRATIGELAESSTIIVLAVKPQVISRVLDVLPAHLSHKPLIISIAAGIALSNSRGAPSAHLSSQGHAQYPCPCPERRVSSFAW